jgi:hypothetical protein
MDRRAPYGPQDRKAQFDAAMRAHALFGDMSKLVDRIEAARAASLARAQALPQGDALADRLRAAAGKLDEVRKKIVATKEGGAITGEQRLREHLDQLYGALTGWEGHPARYQLDRLDVLRRELADVASEYEALAAKDIAALDAELKARKLEGIPTGPRAGADLPELDPAVAAVVRCGKSGGADCEEVERRAAARREQD